MTARPPTLSQDASRQRMELILQQVDQLPTLPAIAVRVLQVASADGSNVRDVCQLIEADPALASRILRLVHRSDLGVSGDVTSLDRAVTLLGFDAVRCAVLAVSVFSTFNLDERPASPFSHDQFWKHCIAVGCCAELLASELVRNWGRNCGVQPGEAFLAGLLHDIGKLALDTAVPKSFAKAVEATDLLRGNIADIERSVIGVDHMVIGKRLAELWQLPVVLRDAIWLHGQLPQALPSSVRNERLINLITLCDVLVRQQHLGYSGNYAFPVDRQILLDALGLLPTQIDAALADLGRSIEQRAQALGLGQAAEKDLYKQALTQANRELSRVSDQLASRNRRLSIRSKYFEALASFQNELRPDAPPATVLHAIGQTAATVLDARMVAAFSMPPAAGYVEIGLVDAEGQLIQSNLIDGASETALPAMHMPDRPAAGQGPVLGITRDMEWLLESFSPRLGATHRYWLRLEVEGQCIGGIVWGGDANEAQRLGPQAQELTALMNGWGLALRTCQIRDEARTLSEQLADVNRRLQSAQSEIDRTKMLKSVAEIAAGAAHEMNNPLAVISGRSQLLASTLADAKDRESAKLIYDKSQKLSDLITALMHFAKPQTPRPIACEMSQLLDSAIEHAKAHAELADRTLDVRGGDVPPAMVDLKQIAEAIGEVVINAIQATDPKTGRVTLAASLDAFGQRLVLSVTDNGCGMDEHVLKHAFDPFFSAKTAGRQQGMGLSKAQRWVESAGGTLRLESRPGGGTRAIFVLPLATADFRNEPARLAQAE
ncbi:MAG: HDOD domain-containing protein [Tepidisphaeraceae bacterium]